jgi:hypothetical protein
MSEVVVRGPADLVVAHETQDSRFEYYVYFRKMVMKIKEYVIYDNKVSKKSRWTRTIQIERWVSTRNIKMWEGYVDNGYVSLDEDCYVLPEVSEINLEEKLENGYQNWLATKAIEEALANI